MVAAGSTLTPVGNLGLRAHRRLLARLQSVPDGVNIVDDIEYADEPAESDTAPPAEAPETNAPQSVPGP